MSEEMIELAEPERKMLLDVYRGKVSSIDCDEIGDKRAYRNGKWIDVGKVSARGGAWISLKRAGLIDDYDSFGGFHYCHITKAGEREAERIIALRSRSERTING